MTSTKTGNVTDSNTAPGENTKDAPAFVTVQSLATFPGAAIAVGIVWKFFDAALGIDHRAVPIVTAFIVAVALWLIAISKQTSTTEKGVGLVLATINGMYLALSVLGIDVGLGEAGITDQIGGDTGG